MFATGSRHRYSHAKTQMALHPDFPKSPYAPLIPEQRWFPADEALRETAYEKLLPPLVAKIRTEVYDWRNKGYPGASPTSANLLRHWFETEHLVENADDHTIMLDGAGPADYRSAVAFFARQLLKGLRLVGAYDVLYGKVKTFMRDWLFSPSPVNLEEPVVLRNLAASQPGAT
jgi:hypothetical protein